MTTTIGRRSTRAILAGAAVAATMTLAAPAGAAPRTVDAASGDNAGATGATSRIMIKVFQASDDAGSSFTARLGAVTFPSVDASSKDPAYIAVTVDPE